MEISELSNDEVTRMLHEAVSRERESLVRVLKTLAEFDKRRLYDRYLPSCFDYCTQRLGYSEGAAFKRIQAARAARDYPSIYRLLEEGELSLAAVVAIRPHLKSDNYRSLINRARRKSKRELEELAASLSEAKAPKRDSVRVVAAALPMTVLPAAVGPVPAAAIPPPLEPVYRVAFDTRSDWMKKYERLRSLVRHKFTDAGFEAVLGQAIDDALQRRDPERFLIAKPRASKGDTRYIPRWVRKMVYERDGGACAHIGPDGRRCGSRSYIQFDHILPYADGGPSNDPANIRLLCGTHNRARNTS